MEMKKDDKIDDYFTRLGTLINYMRNCGDVITYGVVIENVFRTLAIKFDHIVVTIKEIN